MIPDPKLHHAAFRIAPNSLERLYDMLALFGVKELYRQPGARWAMVGQDWLDFNIQLIETDSAALQGDARLSSQISFISEDPETHIAQVEAWAKSKNIIFVKGSWSEREHWFDLQDFFNDSVIEVMHVSILND